MEALKTVRRLFDELHGNHVHYSFLKSGPRKVERSLLGMSDLDILFDPAVKPQLYPLLLRFGFKHFSPVAALQYPGVEDFLGMDEENGTLIHLHIHYHLLLGDRYIRGYHIPWEDRLLGTRILNPQYGIYVPDPNLEFLLFALQEVASSSFSTSFGKRVKQSRVADWNELRSRVEKCSLYKLTCDILSKNAADVLVDLCEVPGDEVRLLNFARQTKPSLRLYRIYGPVAGSRHGLTRRVALGLGLVNRKYIHLPIPFRRVCHNGGVVVAFLGSDGAGKSTQVRQAVSWLSRKLDVFPIYLGSGDGPSSSARGALKLAHRIYAKSKTAHGEPALHQAGSVVRPRRLTQLGKFVWAVTLAYEKRQKLANVMRARNNGMVVISDRYPQNQVMGRNDGPLLHDWMDHPNPVLRWCAKYEDVPYRLSEKYLPDIVIKLTVTEQTACQRRPEMAISEISQRVRIVDALSYPSSVKVARIEGDESLDVVTLRVKREIWNCL